jgi:hypothetical protein
MSIHASFFKDKNFGGAFDTEDLDDSKRYHWVKYGSNFGDEISSFRAHAFGNHGGGGNVYAMTERDFTGKYISLNIKKGKFANWASVGAALDDNIESVIMVNRNANELVIRELGLMIRDDFAETLNHFFFGTSIFGEGEPQVFTTFWPGYDPTHNFVSIRQVLLIKLDNWPDYEATFQYDLLFSLDKSGHLQFRVKWTHIWVDQGLMSNHVLNQIKPTLLNVNIEELGVNLRFRLSSQGLSSVKCKGLYLLPGAGPSEALGDKGDTKEDSTLVLLL